MPTKLSVKDGRVDLKTPEGELVTVDKSEAAQALQQGGYSVPEAAELKESDLSKQFGEGLGNKAKAAAIGFGRGLTGPLADLALTKGFKVDPETIRQITDRNPIPTGVGEVGGLATGAIAAPEASLPGLLSKAGRATEFAAGKVLGSVGTKALGSAVEGAAYGLSQQVDEKVLGNPEVTAQSALAHVGLNALIGGGIGGVLGLATKGAPRGIQAAKNAYNKLAGEVDEPGFLAKGYAKASSLVSGKPEEQILQAWKDRAITASTKGEQAAVQKDFAGSLQEQYKAIEDALGHANGKVRGVETDALMSSVPKEQVDGAALDIGARVQEAVQTMKSEPALYSPNLTRKLELHQELLTRQLNEASTSGQVFKAIDNFKGRISKAIPYGKLIPPELKDSIDLLQNLRHSARTTLEDEAVFGAAGSRQSAFNSAESDYLQNLKEFRKQFMRETSKKGAGKAYVIDPVKVGSYFNQVGDARGMSRSDTIQSFLSNSRKVIQEIDASSHHLPADSFDSKGLTSLLDKNQQAISQGVSEAEAISNFKSIGGQSDRLVGTESGTFTGAVLGGLPGALVGGVVGSLKTPALTIARLASLERAVQRTTSRIEKSFSKVASGQFRAASKITSQHLDSSKAEERMLKIQKLADDQDLLVATMTEATHGIEESAPETSSSMKVAGAAAIAFLASKIPSKPPQDPFTPKYEYSPAEVNKFNRYYQAVKEPLSVLDQMEEGTLTPEAVQALGTVYPQLYQKMQVQAMESLSGLKKGELVPRQSQLMLSMFMGKNLGQALNPQVIIQNQKQFLPVTPGGQGNMNQAKPRKPNFDSSNRSLTPFQATVQRKR